MVKYRYAGDHKMALPKPPGRTWTNRDMFYTAALATRDGLTGKKGSNRLNLAGLNLNLPWSAYFPGWHRSTKHQFNLLSESVITYHRARIGAIPYL